MRNICSAYCTCRLGMPSGRTHDRITLWSLPLVTGLSLSVTASPSLTLWVAAGFLVGGLMLGPDLDIHSVQYKRWGWFRWIWLPYRGSMRHRSPLSHAPITGTMIRVIYLGCWLGLGCLVGLTLINEIFQVGWSWGEIADVFWRSLHRYRYQAFAVLVGLELGACSHYIADWLVSTHKRVKRYGWQAALPKEKSTKRRRSPRLKSPKTTAPKPKSSASSQSEGIDSSVPTATPSLSSSPSESTPDHPNSPSESDSRF